jgi:uncharacterized protein
VASTFLQRAIGLLGRKALPKNEALYFPNASSVHTIGMRFAIDVVYLDEQHRIVEIHRSLKPFRVSWCRNARSLCEFSEGAALELRLLKGNALPFSLFIEGNENAIFKSN